MKIKQGTVREDGKKKRGGKGHPPGVLGGRQEQNQGDPSCPAGAATRTGETWVQTRSLFYLKSQNAPNT